MACNPFADAVRWMYLQAAYYARICGAIAMASSVGLART